MAKAAIATAAATDKATKAYAAYTKQIQKNNEVWLANKAAEKEATRKSVYAEVLDIKKQIKDFDKTPAQLLGDRLQKVYGTGINARIRVWESTQDLGVLDKMKRMKAGAEEFRDIMKDVTERLKTFGMDWVDKLKYRVQQLKDITKEQKDKLYDLLDQLKAKKAAAGMAGVLAGGEMRYIERPAFVDIRSSGQDQIQNRQLTELRRGNTLATEGNTALKEIGKQVWK